MKKRIVVIFIILLFILGIYKEVKAEDNTTTFETYVHGEYMDEDYFYDGDVLFAKYDISGNNFVSFSGYSEEEVEFCMSVSDIDLDDIRYFSDYQNFKFSGSSYTGSFDVVYNVGEYKCLYIMKYVELDAYEGMNELDGIKVSITINNLNVQTFDTRFYVTYNKEVNTYGEKYDVNDTSIFNVKSISQKYSIKLYSDEYSGNECKEGRYKLTYKIYDDLGNEEYYNVFINVLYDKDKSPKIIDNGMPDVLDITSNITLSKIKEYFIAIDSDSSDITKNIIFETDFNEDNKEIKEYYIKATIINSQGYGDCYIKTFNIDDLSAPTILNNEITCSYNKLYEITNIIDLIGVEDYTTYTYEVLNDYYTKSYNVIGKYALKLKLIDKFDNLAEYVIWINVVDDIKPYVLSRNIKTTTSRILSDDDIEESLIISDKTKYKCTIYLDNYKDNYNKIGEYLISVDVVDSFDNKTIVYLYINVVIENDIFCINGLIKTYNNKSYSEEELITLFRGLTDYDYDTESISSIDSLYFKTPFDPGRYEISLTTTSTDGHEYYEVYRIMVIESDEEDNKEIGSRFDNFKESFLEGILRLLMLLFKFLF